MFDATSALRTLQALPLNAHAIAEITHASEPYLNNQIQPAQPVAELGAGPIEIGRALRNAESMIAAALGLSMSDVVISANIGRYNI